METEISQQTMDETMMDHDAMGHDVPVESTTGTPTEEELMYTTGEGVEYQSTVGDISSTMELSDTQVASLTAAAGVWAAISLAILIFSIVVYWKIFTKAGQPGWKSLIPFYNIYVLLQIVGRPGWWLLLFFIPLVNIVAAIIVSLDLAKAFGRSPLFGVVGLILFSLVGYAILAFGKDRYLGPGVQAPQAPQAPVAPAPEAAPPAAPAV